MTPFSFVNPTTTANTSITTITNDNDDDDDDVQIVDAPTTATKEIATIGWHLPPAKRATRPIAVSRVEVDYDDAIARVPWLVVFEFLSLREQFTLSRCCKLLRQKVFAMQVRNLNDEWIVEGGEN